MPDHSSGSSRFQMKYPFSKRGMTQRSRERAEARYDRKNEKLSDLARQNDIDPSGKSNAVLGMMLANRGVRLGEVRNEKILRRIAKQRDKERRRYLEQPQNDNAVIRAFYESWEWKRLSYDIKIARERTCTCCGATPEKDKIRIVCDHIKPIRRYWHLRLDPENVQTLCDDCNRGKGSHDETNWRAQ